MPADRATLVVVRFSPFTAEAMTKSVTKQVLSDEADGRLPRQGVSVFGTPSQGDESLFETAKRLAIRVREHAGGNRLAITTEQELNDEGYHLHLIEPPPGHYLVGKEDLTETPDLAGLAAIFERDRHPNPAEKKG